MLRDSHDRKTCDGNLFFVLLLASGLVSTLGCGLAGDDKDDDAAETGDGALQAGGPMGAAPNGVAFPVGVQDWRPIGAVARADDGTVRAIVGNDTAVDAARIGQTNPWPEGTMLSHFVWDAERNPDDAATIGPGAFKAITLMQKNSAKYAADGGWAFGVWMGESLTPPAAADFDRACVNCHTAEVADKDFVFTVPGQLPDPSALASAPDAPNGVTFPENILDWRVLGVANIQSATPTLRLLVGNQTAVDAARSGETNPWPDGSRISHYQWAAGSNPEIDGVLAAPAVAPGDFLRFTVVQRSSARYEADGDWAYGAWGSMALMPPPAADPQFDRACVACHTTEVADRDMIFTRVGELPSMMLTPTTTAR